LVDFIGGVVVVVVVGVGCGLDDDVVGLGVTLVGVGETLVRVLGTVADNKLLVCRSGCPPHAERTATIAVAAERPISQRRPCTCTLLGPRHAGVMPPGRSPPTRQDPR
jgi:hypothetical protein